MKAEQIADLAVDAIKSLKYDCVRLNIANGDMVGHTGDLAASIQAMETVDRELKRVLDAVNEVGGRFIVTADHGNCDEMVQRNKKGEKMLDKDGKTMPLTSHTLAPVPVAIGGTGLPANVTLRQDLVNPGLANITATYINLLGFEAPSDYEQTLIKID
jgi:2,3-bisphosphoglycerate-independent phosphoglycerate mutase